MDRPAWLREGLVAAWHMEALEYYIRRGYATVRGSGPAELTHLWKEAFNEATVKRYKEIGFNLIIMPLHKGAGLKDGGRIDQGDTQVYRDCPSLRHQGNRLCGLDHDVRNVLP